MKTHTTDSEAPGETLGPDAQTMRALRLAVPEGPSDFGGSSVSGGSGGSAQVELADVPKPQLKGAHDVLIEVRAAGLCRTDLYVADGEIPAKDGVVLGHEGAGFVRQVGPGVRDLMPGTLVGIDPRAACGACADGCGVAGGEASRCLSPRRLGVESDGVFAEFVVVHRDCAVSLPSTVPLRRAAYLEPVAASMGALHARLSPNDRGAIVGDGRIAELTARILEHDGLPRPKILSLEELASPSPKGNKAYRNLDFLIDAGLPDSNALIHMVSALRKGGTLILKSRTATPRTFSPSDWVARELTVAARGYGDFQAAARALSDPSLRLEDLFGPTRPLEAFPRVFQEARASEDSKLFFGMNHDARQSVLTDD